MESNTILTRSGGNFEAVLFEAEIVVGNFGLAFFLALEQEALVSQLLGHLAHAART